MIILGFVAGRRVGRKACARAGLTACRGSSAGVFAGTASLLAGVYDIGAIVVDGHLGALCPALVPAAFCEGRHDLLAIATEDKLHQQYRMPLMPGSREVFDMARLCGAKAVYVSGAGSTVMAVAEKAEAEKFYSKLEKGLELLEGLDGCEAFTLLQLDADNTGATVE